MATASTHDAVVAAAIGAGCVAFVSKDRAASHVVAAVRAAARGEVAFPARVLVQNVLTKLNVHSKLEAVTTAVREGNVAYPT